MAKKKKLTEKKADFANVGDNAQNGADGVSTQASTDNGGYTEEQIQYAKDNVRSQFNEKFSKWAEIEPEDCGDDFIKITEDDYNEAVGDIRDGKYNIGVAEDGVAVRTAEFLKDWNAKFNRWEKGSWRGVIRFDAVITELLNEVTADSTKPLEIDYSTLMFLYGAMMEPAGTGIESAREIARMENYNEETDAPFEEDVPVTYSGVLEKIIGHFKMIQALNKKIVILKQRYDLSLAGLKMNLKISELEEFVEFHNAITDEQTGNAVSEELGGDAE